MGTMKTRKRVGRAGRGEIIQLVESPSDVAERRRRLRLLTAGVPSNAITNAPPQIAEVVTTESPSANQAAY